MYNSLAVYQDLVAANLYVQPEVDKLAHCALGLCGEAGEVADTIKKAQYEGNTLNCSSLLDEMGDVLWYLTQLCAIQGTTLEIIASANLYKLERRYPDGYSHIRCGANIIRARPAL